MFAKAERALATACQPVLMSHPVRWLGLCLLCAAYPQGAITKFFDFGAAIAEMERFGLHPAPAIAALVIFFEVVASAMVITGFLRWIGALALAAFTIVATLIALRFWELSPGIERTTAANAFFEHLGLAGGFLLVSWYSLHKWRRGEADWT